MSKFTSNYAVDMLLRGLDENPDLNKIVYYAISDQYSGAATALAGSLSDVPVVKETIKNAGVVKIDHSIKNELIDTIINVLDPEVKSNNINRRVRSLVDDVLNFAAQKDGSNDILSMFQNVIPVEVTTEHPDTDWGSVLYWILVRSVLVPIVKIPLDKNGKPIIIQDTKKESSSKKKTTTFGKRVARMGEEPQKEKKEEPESKETSSEPIVDTPEEKETPEPNFIMVGEPTTPTPTYDLCCVNHGRAVDINTGDVVITEVIDPKPTTKNAAAKTFKEASSGDNSQITVSQLRGMSEKEFDEFKKRCLNSLFDSIHVSMETEKNTKKSHVVMEQARSIINSYGILSRYNSCPDYYKSIAYDIGVEVVANEVEQRQRISPMMMYITGPSIRHNSGIMNKIHDTICGNIIVKEFMNGNVISNILDVIYRSSEDCDVKFIVTTVVEYFEHNGLDLSKYKPEINNMISNYNLFVA